MLFKTLRKYSLGSASLKLLKESGRQSHAPIFIVGAFDGNDVKLGEGMGSSIKMAEFRACEDALRRIYLTRRSITDEEMRLPSDTLCSTDEWTPEEDMFGDDEVEFQSAGKGGRVASRWDRQPFQERDRLGHSYR